MKKKEREGGREEEGRWKMKGEEAAGGRWWEGGETREGRRDGRKIKGKRRGGRGDIYHSADDLEEWLTRWRRAAVVLLAAVAGGY